MHVGLIPDGNRRFMRKQGIHNLEKSYQLGINNFYDFLEWCIDLRVDEVTAYALSTENLKCRGVLEITTLLNLFARETFLNNERIHRNRIQVRLCGDREDLRNSGGSKVVKNLEQIEKDTVDYDGLILNLCINYGGKQEILNAIRNVVSSGEEVSEESIRDNLWIKSYPEVIIRTSECRLSNFLTWQSAYSEVYFVDKLWQEFGRNDLEDIINNYRERERRFGK